MVSKYLLTFVAILAVCQVITYVVARPDGDAKATTEQSFDSVMNEFKNNLDGLLKGLQNDTLIKDLQTHLDQFANTIQTEAQNLKNKLTEKGSN